MAAQPPSHPDSTHSLAMAMVVSSEAPLLLLNGDLAVIAASASFCRSFQLEPAAVAGRVVHDLGAGEWNVRQLRSLLRATSSGLADITAYEMDLTRDRRETRRLVINARKLDVGGAEIRLLVTISDVTDARAAAKLNADLLREKSILLQEVQHRVANSLQIIASVLLQSARKVQSDETRFHLSDAHNRVMSIATLQQQLAASRLGDVELRPYFTQLCESLGASMIGDHHQLSIEVDADKSAVNADASVSLGLIVTELAINALKHAFPGGREGKITVSYGSLGPDWTLAVSDNGVGMPKGAARATQGLGSNIVQALAAQLNADVDIADGKPGTVVSVVHRQPARVGDTPAERATA